MAAYFVVAITLPIAAPFQIVSLGGGSDFKRGVSIASSRESGTRPAVARDPGLAPLGSVVSRPRTRSRSIADARRAPRIGVLASVRRSARAQQVPAQTLDQPLTALRI